VNKWTTRKIKVSTKYTDEEREAIAFDIISYLQKRTKQGKGKGNKKWTPPADKYSKEYKESLDFKFKRDKSKVNLTLTGDTLASIDLLDSSKGEIAIGIADGDEDRSKAEGNIRGTYGKKTGSRSKSRDFLSIDKNEVKKILNNFPIKDEKKRDKSVLSFTAALAAAKKLLTIPKKERKNTLGELLIGEKKN
jgi:hypothetical protein